MSKPHFEVFASEYHMLQFFGKYLPGLDVATSAKLAPFLYKYDNKLILSRNLYEFLTQMEELTALGIDTRASTQKCKSFLVFFNEQLKNAEDFSAHSVEDIASASTVITLPAVEVGDVISTEVPGAPASLDTVSATIEHSQPAPAAIETVIEANNEELEKQEFLKQAEALRDDTKKAASKADLEKLALTKGISLSKAKTFDDMMEDLKTALL